MRGIGTTFSRYFRFAAGLVGVAILAGIVAPRALAQTDEVALAVPRVALHEHFGPDSDGLILPRPLSAPDVVAVRRLLAAARAGCVRPDSLLTPLLTDATGSDGLVAGLAGHGLAVQALRCGQAASVGALRDWLRRWPDLPEAPAVARLLRRRDPTGAIPTLRTGLTVVTQDSRPVADGAGLRPSGGVAARVAGWLRAGEPEPALRLVTAARGLAATDRAMLEAEIAQGWFVRNRDPAALALAEAAARTAPSVGFASYVAGLAAWRLGRSGQALADFAQAASATGSGARIRAAAAYWAARASLATGDRVRWQGWLRDAAASPDTLYGMVARRMLGWSAGTGLARDVLGEADLEAVAAAPGGGRAFALLQLGEEGLAAGELRQLAGREPVLARAVVLIAERAGMFALAADLAGQMDGREAARFDAVRYPVPALRPTDGFLMDPALVYAISQVESHFDAGAVSAEGAVGLMQVMPGTARRVGRAGGLRDPAANLAVGQRYLATLAAAPMVRGDLIRLLASYNDGPGKCAAWCGRVRDFGDPLLFIEAIPVPETRQFVERTLTGTWIYAARLRLPTPSLDAVVEGRFPRFSPRLLAPRA